MPINPTTAERVRDLASQISELTAEDVGEIVFIDASPDRKPQMLYSMLDGEPIPIPAYMVPAVLSKRAGGNYLFTANKSLAPTYKQGKVKCFLHPEAPERPILDEIGLSGKQCMSGMLANNYSKRIHAQRRHKAEWAAFQDHIAEESQQQRDRRQEQQVEAMMRLAGAAGEPDTYVSRPKREVPTVACPECGKSVKGHLALSGHMRVHKG